MSFYLRVDLVILNRFSDDAVAVEDGLCAVGTGLGSGGGAKVDFGNDETYLHGLTALFRSRNVS
jgi:hypothetical protein